MKNDFLKKPVLALDLANIQTISDLLTAYRRTSFQSRTLAMCADVFLTMLDDPDRPTIFLGIAGAMVPAGMHGVVSTMIKQNMIDVIVSTGANMYHDFVEALGEHHYIGSSDADDEILRKEGIDRIYDTYADEAKFRAMDNVIMSFSDKLVEKANCISSRFFLQSLGELINKTGVVGKLKNSVIWNCWKNNVPIFIPAMSDSSLGLGITQHYIKALDEGRQPLIIDEMRDNVEILQIKKNAKKTGVIYVGGGVPKNYIQQTAYLEDMFGIPDAEHDYGFQITTDSPQWGGLSGCTFKEAISWGKEKPGGKYATCYCDATIALPLIVKSTLERCKNLDKRKRLDYKF